MSGTGQTVSDVGETALLERVRARLGGGAPDGEVWAGDDTAVLTSPGPRLLFATDTLTADVDFKWTYASGVDVGWKALAVNLSDIAAMCGRPTHAVASVTLTPDLPLATFEEMLDGLARAGERFGCALVGGDIGEGRETSITVAILGTPLDEQPVLRSGARPGDAICVTGALGGAAGGLAVLTSEVLGSDLSPETRAAVDTLVTRHLRPEPRVGVAAALAGAGVTAMIDISDGLAVDLARLVASSEVGCSVATDRIPVDPALETLAGLPGVTLDPPEAAILGGEDFELLFTVSQDRVEDALRAGETAGVAVTAIGEATEGPAELGGRPLDEWRRRGWDHLQNR